MYKYIIEGGYPVSGKVRASGNKNAALPCLAAAVLANSPVTLRNIPEIEDVLVMTEVLRYLGAEVRHPEANVWIIDPRSIDRYDVPVSQARKVRASILLQVRWSPNSARPCCRRQEAIP